MSSTRCESLVGGDWLLCQQKLTIGLLCGAGVHLDSDVGDDADRCREAQDYLKQDPRLGKLWWRVQVSCRDFACRDL